MTLNAPEEPVCAETPRTLWVELTSKCPFDCIFCSRKLRRGNGRHLPFPAYARLVESLVAPRRLVLNYSGESFCYPDLVPAIELGCARGAFVELVTAFPPLQSESMRALAASGLGRLTVSLHTADPTRYREIYGCGSLEGLEARLKEFLDLCREQPAPPAVEFAFVAMERNLDQLEPVADFARLLGISRLTIFPVIRRDPISERFPFELQQDGIPTGEFRKKVRRRVEEVRQGHAAIRFIMTDASFDGPAAALGEVPVPCPGRLPEGAFIHSCEQNPRETAHVLSNGDVVACEALDRTPLGNLFQQSIGEIWLGERYHDFRRRYRLGQVAECRSCAWKSAYKPGPLKSEVLAREGASAQLLYGWHECRDEDVIWSTQEAAALLRPRVGSRSIHLSGLLPQGGPGRPNYLAVTCNGQEIGKVENPWDESMPFGLDFSVPEGTVPPWRLGFRIGQVLRPNRKGLGTDDRDLGFALVLLASNRAGGNGIVHRASFSRLRREVERMDRLGRWLRLNTARRHGRMPAPQPEPGISVLIPERDQVEELALCLESVERAAARCPEAVETIVMVNGAAPGKYGRLRRQFSQCRWLFATRPLGFNEAVRRGLRAGCGEWVYLLNNDVVIDAEALARLLAHRAPQVFSIGSQILLKDATRYREETNWTAFLMEDGLATVHDRIPPGGGVSECFYTGGGASLFQRRALAALVADSAAYSPFYWEDVEWGWRARKMGYQVLFCADSVARHTQRATIRANYTPDEVEQILERNRLLFQLRNLTAAGSLDRVFDEMARLGPSAAACFERPSIRWATARLRLWNHLAARDDQQILADAAGLAS